MKFEILGSSSSGNCSFLRTAGGRFLIDAGLTAKAIGERLEAIGERVEEIDGVFITHEHEDHVRGLSGLLRYAPGLSLVANKKTAEAVIPRLKKVPSWCFFETGARFSFSGLQVYPLPLPHDAVDPVGYVFEWEEPGAGVGRLAWVTDLGHVPAWLGRCIQDVDILVLESNYEESLLEADTQRPFFIKQRILGPQGHLSNRSAVDLLSAAAPTAFWKSVYLAHLSPSCNAVEIVKKHLEAAGLLTQAFSTHIVQPG